jgi:hypothetical protein
MRAASSWNGGNFGRPTRSTTTVFIRADSDFEGLIGKGTGKRRGLYRRVQHGQTRESSERTFHARKLLGGVDIQR